MASILRRDHAAYVHQFLARLPRGMVWPRHATSVLYRVVEGITKAVAGFDTRAFNFAFAEAFPPRSFELLPDWERVLGLPEPCFPAAQTIEERRLQVEWRLAARPGGQSLPFFYGLAERLGYHLPNYAPSTVPASLPMRLARSPRITITEYRPFMFGVSRLGDPSWQFAPPRMRFLWTVRVPDPRLTWFRFGESSLGEHAHLSIRRAEDLECIFHKLKPGHTKLIFDYSGGT